MPDEITLCPTCHSRISDVGSRTKDTDEPGVPVWSNDPILTSNGFNGEEYIGNQFVSIRDIREIQELRKSQEVEFNIEPKTEFADTTGSNVEIQATHLIELRISTERVLDAVGESLQDYFRLDSEGNLQPAGPHDTQDKTDWTDVTRGRPFDSKGRNLSILLDGNTKFNVNSELDKAVPSIPSDNFFVRAIHLEDLRHPILSSYIEYFEPAENFSATLTAPFLIDGTNSAFATYSDRLLGTVSSTYEIFVTSESFRFDGNAINSSPVSINISENTPNNGASHKLTALTDGNIFEFTNTILMATQTDITTSSVTITSEHEDFLRLPFKITPSLSIRAYIDYSLNGTGRVDTGPQIPTSTIDPLDPFFDNLTYRITFRATVLTSEPPFTGGSKALVVLVGIVGGSHVQNTAIIPGFVSPDPGFHLPSAYIIPDLFQFDSSLNLWFIDIPLNDIVTPPSTDTLYTLSLFVQTNFSGGAGGTVEHSTSIFEWSGYRVRR